MTHEGLKSAVVMLGLIILIATGVYEDCHARADGMEIVKDDAQARDMGCLKTEIIHCIRAGHIDIACKDFEPEVVAESACNMPPALNTDELDIGEQDIQDIETLQEPFREVACVTSEATDSLDEETSMDMISENSSVQAAAPIQVSQDAAYVSETPETVRYCTDGAICRMMIPSAGIDVDVFPCEKWGAPDLYDVSISCGGGYIGDLDCLLICGHNTRTLKQLKHTEIGDIITLTAPDGATFTYKVDVSKVCRVVDNGLNLEDPDTREQYITTTYGAPALHLTIYTCCGDDGFRYVVRAVRMEE